jgi:hypothetical protein
MLAVRGDCAQVLLRLTGPIVSATGDHHTVGSARPISWTVDAHMALDPDRSVLYFDLVYAALGEAGRKSPQAMDAANYGFQSEFARRYLSQGEAKGRVEGEAKVLIRLLALKFGALSDAVRDRVQTARAEELELWTERVLRASTLEDGLR